MVYLDFCIEQPLLEMILMDPQRITILPEETYNKFYKYILQEELYEDIPKLESVKNKLTTKTLYECMKDAMSSADWVEIE
jgi:hypothetical protein